jgi:hypothetical protein
MADYPFTEFCRILESGGAITLSVTAGGKNHFWTLTKGRLHQLLASGHEALAEIELQKPKPVETVSTVYIPAKASVG